MRTSLLKEVGKYLESRKNRRRLQWAAAGMGAVVICATVYALVMPAITMERETYCSQEEHKHSGECYKETLVCEESELSKSQRILDCQLQLHSHVDDCYDEEGNLICGYADFVVHSHDENCYDSEGRLVCRLPEIEEHTHTESCYTEESRLICGQEESEGHYHTDACYTERETGNYICGLEEDENHIHTDACLEKVSELTCGQEESEGHYHTDSCYETVRNYTCGKEEAILHKHNADCYETDENGQQQRICGMTEVLSHVHDDSCFVQDTEEESAHTHTDACYEKELICGQEEHEHTDACFVNPEEAQAETEDGTNNLRKANARKTDETENADGAEGGNIELTVECGKEEHVHNDNCYNNKGELTCETEEHTHVLACYSKDAQAAVEYVESLIEALPTADELEEKMEEYGDTQEGESYYSALTEQAAEACSAYESLADELKKFIDTESDKFQVMRSLAEAYNPADGFEYTSNLADTKMEVAIKDSAGNVVDPGGTVTIGNSYLITLYFEEGKKEEDGKNIQFKYNDEGCLTYQLPVGFAVKPVEKAYITADGGNFLGEYSITADGQVKVKLYDVDEIGNPTEGKNLIDNSEAAWVTFTLEAVARLSGDSDVTRIEWDGNGEANYILDDSAAVKVSKKGTYDSATHTIEYEIVVEDTNGLIKAGGELTDTMDSMLDYVPGTMKVTVKDGAGKTVKEMTEDELTVETAAAGGFMLKGLPEMVKGEKLVVTYKAKVSDEVYDKDAEFNYTAENTATFDGKSYGDKDVTGKDTSKVPIDSNAIQKSGKLVNITDQNGNKISVIEWTVIIGDGSETLGDKELTIVDELVGDQAFYCYTDSAGKEWIKLECALRTENYGDLTLEEGVATGKVDSGNSKKAVFTLPTIEEICEAYKSTVPGLTPEECNYTRAQLKYYTTYNTQGNLNDERFENKVKVTIENGDVKTDYETTGEVGISGAAPTVDKQMIGSDSENIEYKVTVSVPGALYGKLFFLSDMAVFYNVNGVKDNNYYVDNNITITDITCVAADNPNKKYVFKEYGTQGTADATYCLVNVPGFGVSGDRQIIFNAAPNEAVNTRWNIPEDTKLTITYTLPKDSLTGPADGSDGVTDTSTVRDVLKDPRHELYNQVNAFYLDYNHSAEDSAKYREQNVLQKEGHIRYSGDGTEDTVNYTVTFKNFSEENKPLTSLIFEKNMTGVKFVDEYDSKYLSFDNDKSSLVVTIYNPEKPSEVWGEFKYDGNPDSDGDGVIEAAAEKFIATDKSHPISIFGYKTLAEWFKNGVPKMEPSYYETGTVPGIYKFTYTLQVNKDAVENAKVTSIPLKNTANIEYDGGDLGKVTNTLQYNTGLIGKEAEKLYEGGSSDGWITESEFNEMTPEEQEKYKAINVLQFTIELNQKKNDLVKDGENYQVIDTMENLAFYVDTIKVEKNEGTIADPNWSELTKKLSQSEVTEEGGNYSFTYNSNELKVTVPDTQHIRITYRARILDQNQDVKNTAAINGDIEMQKSTQARYEVERTVATAGGSGFTLVKQNAYNEQLLPGVKFSLYSSINPGTETTQKGITMKDGSTKLLYYIGEIETGSEGSVIVPSLGNVKIANTELYMLEEVGTPGGYLPLDKPIVFYFQNNTKDWGEQVDKNSADYEVRELDASNQIFVKNEPYGIVLPETGSFGIIRYTLAGVALIGAAGLVYIKRIRKQRKVLRR